MIGQGSSMVTCRSCGAALPEGAVFCADCGFERPSLPPHVTSSAQRPGWVLPVIGVSAAAVISAMVFAMVIGGSRGTGQPVAGSSALGTPSASPSQVSLPPASTPSEVATPSAAPSLVTAPPIANGAIARVAVDALNMRSDASPGAELVTTVGRDALLFIIGAPTDSGDLRWYRVASVEADLVGDIGWVATPASGGDPWIVESAPTCPRSPVVVEQLIELPPLVRLSCFGSDAFTGTGWADNACCGYVGPLSFTPQWLAWPPTRWFRAENFFDILTYRLAPPPGEDWATTTPVAGDIITFRGHFDDPAAESCRVALAEDADPSTEVPTAAETVLECRTQLVVEEFEVIGHEGEGACGCLQPPSPSAHSRQPVHAWSASEMAG